MSVNEFRDAPGAPGSRLSLPAYRRSKPENEISNPSVTHRVPLAQISPAIRAGLWLLLEAQSCVEKFQRYAWDFAVEIGELRAAGLTTTALRWLMCSGFVEAAIETTRPGAKRRTFRRVDSLTLSEKTCFVLTEAGVLFAQDACREAMEVGPPVPHDKAQDGNGNGKSNGHLRPEVPRWDAARRELRVGDLLVKRFMVPALNQETILAAFEEEGWPPRIDDPLHPQADQDPTGRIHEAIRGLNRNQKHRLIHFRSDGRGQGICWEPILGTDGRVP